MIKAAAHLLVVDDDDRLRELLGRYLTGEKFAVSLAENAQVARSLLGLFHFDLMVLDVLMPGESGLSLAADVKKQADAPPILMLSALAEAGDRVAGLEAGVDDYLAKPFEPKELVLRIQAILRRTAVATPGPGRVAFGDFVFDCRTRELLAHGAPLHLTAAERTLLACLAEQIGVPVSREQLAEQLGQSVSGRNIDVQIARLRRKLGGGSSLQTMRGAGYALYGSRL